VGKGWKRIEASSRGSENNCVGICEAHHVGISPQEDRGGTAGKMGEGEGASEEGGVKRSAIKEPATSVAGGVIAA
jgi:hypothetical protein